MPGFLLKAGFDDESMRLAITQIISRAVYPASELGTTRWIQENSSVKLKNYKIVENSQPIEIKDNKHQKIILQKVESEKY